MGGVVRKGGTPFLVVFLCVPLSRDVMVDETYRELKYYGRYDFETQVTAGLPEIVNSDYASDKLNNDLLDAVRRGNAWSWSDTEFQTAAVIYDTQWNVEIGRAHV